MVGQVKNQDSQAALYLLSSGWPFTKRLLFYYSQVNSVLAILLTNSSCRNVSKSISEPKHTDPAGSRLRHTQGIAVHPDIEAEVMKEQDKVRVQVKHIKRGSISFSDRQFFSVSSQFEMRCQPIITTMEQCVARWLNHFSRWMRSHIVWIHLSWTHEAWRYCDWYSRIERRTIAIVYRSIGWPPLDPPRHL